MSNYKHFGSNVAGETLIDLLFSGYDSSNPGNFINKGEEGWDESSVKQTVAGILDIQGTAGDTQAQAQAILDAAPQGANIKDLLQDLAGTSAAEIQEGTYQDKNYGHTYLMAVADPTYAAEHDIDVTGATVADLYDKGLMRTGSADDLKYWGADDQGSIADVAANFLKTSESQTHQAFDKYFGRMAGSEGLDYFAGITSTGDVKSEEEELATAQGLTLSDYIGGIIGYTGGTINEATGKDWDVSAETLVRNDLYSLAGEASTAAQKHSLYYTAPKVGEVSTYVDKIRDARKLGDTEGAAAETAVKDEIFSKANQLVGANLGDYDDLGGIAAGNATGMGRFLSDVEQQKGFEEGKTGQDWYDETKGTVWGALKGEVDKTTIDPKDIIDDTGETIKKIDTEVFLENRAKDPNSPYYDPDFDINDYRMWNQKYLDDGGEKKISDPNEWTLDPKKPDLPTDIPINKQQVDYMPHLTSDVQLPSDVKYADRAKEFDTQYRSVPGTAQTAQGTAGQRFTGTSAKGVRMKRSKASRMGTIRGTKQLGREQQTKSLNI
jgi:hypothetical protein